jgi:hypothetical protein
MYTGRHTIYPQRLRRTHFYVVHYSSRFLIIRFFSMESNSSACNSSSCYKRYLCSIHGRSTGCRWWRRPPDTEPNLGRFYKGTPHVCMHVCMYINMYVCMSMFVCVYGLALCVNFCMYLSLLCAYIYVYHLFTHTYVLHVYLPICVYMYLSDPCKAS